MEWMILPLKRYADFRGRSRRKEYWMFYLFTILIGIAFAILSAVVGGTAALSGNETTALAAGGAVGIIAILQLVINLGLIVPSIAVGVRRLHDTDRTGWWLWAPVVGVVVLFGGLAGAGLSISQPNAASGIGNLVVVGIVGGIVIFAIALAVFVFMCLPGTDGPNRFGPDPKDPDGDLETVFS
jgi:uncharacterized membrane protein YhaH (DUF805 family)